MRLCARNHTCKFFHIHHISFQVWHNFLLFQLPLISIDMRFIPGFTCKHLTLSWIFLYELQIGFFPWCPRHLNSVTEEGILEAFLSKISTDCSFWIGKWWNWLSSLRALMFPGSAELRSMCLLCEMDSCLKTTVLQSAAFQQPVWRHSEPCSRITSSWHALQVQPSIQSIILEGRRGICCLIYLVFQPGQYQLCIEEVCF